MSAMLDDLVGRFRQKSRQRLEEMLALIDVLDRHPPYPGSIDRLMRHYHALSGLGSTYGYPEVSRLGEKGEELLMPIVRANGEPTAEVIASLRELAKAMQRELE